MEYERVENQDRPHRLTFTGDESEAVRAAYREHIYFLAQLGNPGSISEYESWISGWEDDKEPKSVRPIDPIDVVEVLEEFVQRTGDVIVSIPEISGIPAFASDDIGERHRLSKLAEKIAKEIREAIPQPEFLELPEDPIVEITEDALQGWLTEDPREE